MAMGKLATSDRFPKTEVPAASVLRRVGPDGSPLAYVNFPFLSVPLKGIKTIRALLKAADIPVAEIALESAPVYPVYRTVLNPAA